MSTTKRVTCCFPCITEMKDDRHQGDLPVCSDGREAKVGNDGDSHDWTERDSDAGERA